MDNISDLLSSLSEEDMENIKAVAKDLFSGEDGGAAPRPELAGMDLSTLGALMKPAEDERTRFIRSLKPLLSEERRHRADEAVRLLQLVSLLPVLRQSGILENFLGGNDG